MAEDEIAGEISQYLLDRVRPVTDDLLAGVPEHLPTPSIREGSTGRPPGYLVDALSQSHLATTRDRNRRGVCMLSTARSDPQTLPPRIYSPCETATTPSIIPTSHLVNGSAHEGVTVPSGPRQ